MRNVIDRSWKKKRDGIENKIMGGNGGGVR